MNEKILTDCGLSIEQAKIYTYLLRNGLSPAKQISLKTGIGRALTYKIVDQLVELKLVEKRDDIGKIALFLPTHPHNLKEMIDKKEQSLNIAISSFSSIFGILSSEFNALSGKPNIQFYEGIVGLQTVYNDILDLNQDISIISSPMARESEDSLKLIREQILKQASQNIHTRAITPLHTEQTNERVAEDTKNLITRKKIPADRLNIPAQIVVYGDKVSITNFKESILTVVIESKYISETFRIMFNYIWENTK